MSSQFKTLPNKPSAPEFHFFTESLSRDLDPSEEDLPERGLIFELKARHLFTMSLYQRGVPLCHTELCMSLQVLFRHRPKLESKRVYICPYRQHSSKRFLFERFSNFPGAEKSSEKPMRKKSSSIVCPVAFGSMCCAFQFLLHADIAWRPTTACMVCASMNVDIPFEGDGQ